MNVKCLYAGLDKHRFGAQCFAACELSVYGIGHCHGLSSIFAACLYPLSPILGVYVRYTGGFHFDR